MKLLLDTHVFLWALLEPERLNLEARVALSNPESRLFLASISVWEVLLLAEKGRITLDSPAETWVRQVLGNTPIHDLPLSSEIAILSRTLALPHQDPADRFIAATANVHNLTLLTADRHLLKCHALESMRAD